MTQEDTSAHRWMRAFKLVGGEVGKSASLTPRSEYEDLRIRSDGLYAAKKSL